MKKTLLFLAAVAFSFGSAIAQDQEGVEKALTSNSSLEVGDTSAACGSEYGTAESYYFKLFDMEELEVSDVFHIQSVDFGVEVISLAAGLDAIDVNVDIYTTGLNNFPATWGGDDYFNAGSTTVRVKEEDEGQLVTAHFDDPIDVLVGQNVVVRISHEDLEGMAIFFIGSNGEPDSQTSYLAADDCGIAFPTPVAEVGFPEMHIIMVLNGTEGYLGMQDFANAELSLYPNPASDQFNITSGNETIHSVVVRDILGKTVATYNVDGLEQNVNISNLPKGMYLVEVELETGKAVQKLIKK